MDSNLSILIVVSCQHCSGYHHTNNNQLVIEDIHRLLVDVPKYCLLLERIVSPLLHLDHYIEQSYKGHAMAVRVSGSFHSPHVEIELALRISPTLKFMGFARLSYCCLYFFCAVFILAAANSLADDKESTSSSRYSVRSTGPMDSVGKNAASVGDQQSTPNSK